MLHPILIPILLIPHIIIPSAVILYIIYHDESNTVPRVYACSKDYESINIDTTFDDELLHYVVARHIRRANIIQSPMHECATNMIYEHEYVSRINELYYRRQQLEASPLRHFIMDHAQELIHMFGLKTKPIRLITPLNSASYNCNSPMFLFITGSKTNKICLRSTALSFRLRINDHRWITYTLISPMRTLAKSPNFKTELSRKTNATNINRFYYNFWQACIYHYIIPKIPAQRGKVMSKLCSAIVDSQWYAKIIQESIHNKYDRMEKSPLRTFITNNSDKLEERHYNRSYRTYITNNHPMHQLALAENKQIIFLADKKRLNRTINTSPMHQWGCSNKNQLLLANALCNRIKKQSPYSRLKNFICNNLHELQQQVALHNYIRINRTKYNALICSDLIINYGTLYRKYMMLNFRKVNNIPEVQFKHDCSHTVFIAFPKNMLLVHQFLTECNVDGFNSISIYWDTNNFQSYAYSLLGKNACINDLTDAAYTFLNISNLTHEDTYVQLLSDSNKIIIPDTDQCKRHIWIYFVKRDLSKFTSSQFATCVKKINEFFKRLKNSQIQVQIGSPDQWLSDKLLICIEGPALCDERYDNISSDLINFINLVKGVIFAKIEDRVSWIHLPLL
jgi:hypothetical protein